jgi:E3 ubiquitin-protein ligase RAD18
LITYCSDSRSRLLQIARNQSVPTKPREDIQKENDHPVVEESTQRIPSSNPEIRCPICNRPFGSVEQIDLHIDSCTGPLSTSYNLRPSRSSNVSSGPSTNNLINPLPKLNYAMYNEAKLRSMLAGHRLPTHGNKALLIARHKEFVNLYNANIDRQSPQSHQELLRGMAEWESAQQMLNRGEKRKEFDTEEWGRKCKDEFAELTKRARENAKKQRIEQRNGSVSEAEPSVVRSSQEETVAQFAL